MTTLFWQGQAPAIAQDSHARCTGGIVNGDTYTTSVNGEVIASITADGTTSSLQMVQALASGWNAATGNPYARAITASGYSTGAISRLRWTADVPGNPFTVSVASDGVDPWEAVATDTANGSPNDWDNGDNWSTGSAPVTGDEVYFRDSASDVLWGLDQAGIELDLLAIEQTYTGRIGLSSRVFVTGAGGASSDDRPEYRDHYLDVGWSVCRIGEIVGPGNAAGSARLKLSNDHTMANVTEIYDTASTSTDGNVPTVRLLLDHASSDLRVRRAPGGVGVAVDVPGETSTMNDVDISDETPASRVFIGEGVTMGQWTQQGGDNVLRSAAAVTGVNVLGGELAIEGTGYTVGTLNVGGGTVYPNSTPTGGNAITTINLNGGTVDGTESRAARTWGTVNMLRSGSTLVVDPDVVTVTSLTPPTDSGAYTVSVA